MSSQENTWRLSLPARFTPGFYAWIQEWQTFLEVSEISHLHLVWTPKEIFLFFRHPGKAHFPINTVPFIESEEGTFIGSSNSVYLKDFKSTETLLLQTPQNLFLTVQSLNPASAMLSIHGQTEEIRLQFVEKYLRSWCFHVETTQKEILLSVQTEALSDWMKQFFLAIESWELLRYPLKPSRSILDRLYHAGSTNPLLYYFLAKHDISKWSFWLEEGKKKNLDTALFCRRFADYALADNQYTWSLQALNQINQVDEDVFSKKGYVLILLERDDEARDLFLEVLKRNPKHEWSLFNLGRIAFRKAQYAQAMAYFQKAQSVLAKPEFARYLGSCYLQMKEWDKAIPLLKKLRDAGNTDPLLISELATAYLKTKNHDLAKKILEQAPATMASHPLILLLWSEFYLETKHPQEALKFAEAVQQKYPENLRASFLKGKALLRLESFSEAKNLLQKVYEKEPKNLEIQEELGHLYLSQGEIVKALEWLKRGQCNDLAYARCLHYNDQKDEALAFFERYLTKEIPLLEETAIAHLRFLLEINLQESLNQGQRYLKQWPHSVELLFYLGQGELLRENYGMARKYFQQCLQLFPEYEYFYLWNDLSHVFLHQPTTLPQKNFQLPWLNQLKNLVLERPENQPQTEDQWLEFYFYMGFYKVAIGKRALGEQLLKKCLETKKQDHIEFRFAKAYLQR